MTNHKNIECYTDGFRKMVVERENNFTKGFLYEKNH